jgi:hypothetical protein
MMNQRLFREAAPASKVPSQSVRRTWLCRALGELPKGGKVRFGRFEAVGH